MAVHLAVWLQGENITDHDITKMVLESHSDMHLSEEKDISAQSESGSDHHTDDFTGTKFTQWTDNTSCRPTVPVVRRFTGSPSVL